MMTLATTTLSPRSAPVWQRLPGESSRAYAAFRAYRDMGPNRSLDRVALALYPEQSGHKKGSGRRPMTTSLKTWSMDHDWVRRVAAWDEHLDREAQAALVEEVRHMARYHARVARQMVDVAVRGLQERLAAMETRGELWSLEESRKYLLDGIKLERLVRGLPGEAVEQQVTGPVAVGGFEMMSREDRIALFEKLSGGEGPK